MGNALLYRMPSGIPGATSREENKTIEAVPYGATSFPTYGIPYKYASGTVVPIGAADVGASVVGFLVRPYPLSDANATPALGTSTPPTKGIANGLRRGYMTVKNLAGTPALGGTVYVRIDTPAGIKVVGGIEAASDTTHSVAIPNCIFNGAADADGNAEIAYNI